MFQTNPLLVFLTKQLSPAVLRFGGSGNDYFNYDVPAGAVSPTMPACLPGRSYPDVHQTTPDNIARFRGFKNAANYRDLRCVCTQALTGAGCKTCLEHRIVALTPFHTTMLTLSQVPGTRDCPPWSDAKNCDTLSAQPGWCAAAAKGPQPNCCRACNLNWNSSDTDGCFLSMIYIYITAPQLCQNGAKIFGAGGEPRLESTLNKFKRLLMYRCSPYSHANGPATPVNYTLYHPPTVFKMSPNTVV